MCSGDGSNPSLISCDGKQVFQQRASAAAAVAVLMKKGSSAVVDVHQKGWKVNDIKCFKSGGRHLIIEGRKEGWKGRKGRHIESECHCNSNYLSM